MEAIRKPVEELDIKCGDCGTVLASIVVTTSNKELEETHRRPLFSRFQVGCYKCNGQSFMSKVIEGITNIGTPSEKIVLEPVDTDVRDGVIVNKLNTRKLDVK